MSEDADAGREETRTAAIRAAIGKFAELRREYHSATAEKERAKALMSAAEERIRAALEGHARLEGMAQLFGFDLHKEYKDWREKQGRLPNSEMNITPPATTEIAAAIAEANRPKLIIKDQVVAAARDKIPHPVRAWALRQQLADSGIYIHEKTVGMTLYRLLREGVIRREGRDWFFVPEDQRDTADPEGEESPGDEPGFDLHAAE